MSEPLVTILIPNYKTPDITRICLRLLRMHTDMSKVHIIAIDNDSDDDSLDYLRSLDWIELIERPNDESESPSESHSKALDDALARVTTPYVLSIHTDTFMRDPNWLEFLLENIQHDENIAGVGSWKLEVKPLYKLLLKKLEYWWQSIYFPLIGKGYGKLEGKGDNFNYLRSHCALYRTDLLHEHKLSFWDHDRAGRMMHKKLVDLGYEMKFIPSEILIKYVVHLNHATMFLNNEFGISKKNVDKGMQRMEKIFRDLKAPEILADTSLDG